MKNYKVYLGVLIGYVLFCVLSSEKIPQEGLGWDGNAYYVLACTFSDRVRDKTIDQYKVQRILPPMLIHYGLRLVDKSYRLAGSRFYERTAEVIVTCFMVFNGFVLVLSAYFLLGIAHFLAFSLRQKIMFFVGLYGSFFLLKQVFYYPPLTDYTAFLIGLALLYYYLKNHKIGLLAMLFLGSFTFPNLIYCGIILFLFPYEKEKTVSEKTPFSHYFALFLAFAVMGFTAYLALFEIPNTSYLNLFLVLAYLFFSLKDSSQPLEWLFYLKKGNFWKRFALVLGFVFLIKWIQFLIANHEAGELTLWKALQINIVGTSLRYPLAFLPAHFMFFGLISFVPLFFWKKTLSEIRKLGTGFNMLIYLYFFLLLNAESRTHVSIFPFFVLISVILLKEKLENNRFFYSLIVVQLILSKFWYPINTPEIYTADRTYESDLLQFPWQNWFMNSGYLVNEMMYSVHVCIFALVCLYFFLLNRHVSS